MSNQSNSDISLEEQITLLTKALQRERNAKKQLEEKLESKTLENFKKNSEFFEAYEKAYSRQIQLQLLSTLTSDIFTLNNVNDMTAKFLSNISTFLDTCEAFVFEKQQNQETLLKLNKDTELLNRCAQKLPQTAKFLAQIKTQEQWQRLSVGTESSLSEISPYFTHDTVLIFPLKPSSQLSKYLILNIDHYCYSNDFKQTINTACKQFATAIEKQIAEVEVSYNYLRLKRTLKELKSTQRQLIHQEKMASLGEMSAGIAHEINNPLGYVLSNFDVLNEYFSEFEKCFFNLEQSNQIEQISNKYLSLARSDTKDLLESCNKGLNRIADIISNLKTFSRKDTDEFEPHCVNEIISGSLKIVWNQLKNYKFTKEFATNLPQIEANEGQLQQVFVNLFINAIQAMDDGDTFTIVTQLVDDFVEVSINDSGSGMSKKTIEKLFEPFYTTKDKHEGTGLGLSVSYAILEKHQALVSVNSELGVGSTFTLRFPHI